MKEYLLNITLLLASANMMAQDNLPGVLDPPKYPCEGYLKENVRRQMPYTHLRAPDVAWEKRVWREIDLREKINMKLYYPVQPAPCRASVFHVLAKNILSGNILAFYDEDFMRPMDPTDFRKKIVKIDTVDQEVYTEDGESHWIRVARADSTSIYERVLKYCLKEDWFFDKQKSTLDVRIVGIAGYEYDYEKEFFKEMFWVYFPACRPYFAANETFNSFSDSERRSLDDIFWKRQFSSTIVKESNVYDRYINQYENGIQALVESEKIKNSIFTWEHDLWHY